MRQLSTPQVRVHQSRGDPELGQPQPRKRVLRAGFHEECDDLAALEALAFEVPGYAVADGIPLIRFLLV